MENISPENQKRLKELTSRQWGGLFRSRASEVRVITELGHSREVGLLPVLLDFAVHPVSALATAARTAVEALLRTVPRERLATLDVWLGSLPIICNLRDALAESTPG